MTKTLYELLQTHYGIKTSYRINPEVIRVETTSTKVLSFNPNRLGFVIVNNGGSNIFISPERVTLVGGLYTGILLVPNGGTLTMKWDVDFELVSNEYFGLAEGVASNIYALEVYTL